MTAPLRIGIPGAGVIADPGLVDAAGQFGAWIRRAGLRLSGG